MVCVAACDNSSTYTSPKIDPYDFDLFRIANAETGCVVTDIITKKDSQNLILKCG
jgi:hypothetical protein